MTDHFSIRLATQEDAALLPQLEDDAGSLFATMPLDFLQRLPAEIPFGDVAFYHQRIAQQLCWVAQRHASKGQSPQVVGVICADWVLEDKAYYIAELSVAPLAQGQGIGRALVSHMQCFAKEKGVDLTLTTFREVPWNAPFYRSCGFVELSAPVITPFLEERLSEQASHGFLRDDRCAMRWSFATSI
ncbi:hypothetical protein VST7929_01107 [Vibrio stylophorae]|uniref:N-acetyltransferase domain-containing protein n=1 Tax=Vibrio stylophorae TaxID=659351 RepID=A0ABN8DRS1_9VIBR|nr:GNAT family N-acetyltransferase [Vibrio stylophorae]CAH0533243.1 hypothetical protein VST7929_01107 [Vibrio stylophorae]